MTLQRVSKYLAICLLAAWPIAGTAGPSVEPQTSVELPGVNLPSGSFGPPGNERERDYTYPTAGDVDYFTQKGFKALRIAFFAKRVLTQDASGRFIPTEDMEILAKLIDYAATKNALVILDMHDYGLSISDKLIGRDPGSAEEFAATWKAIAAEVADKPNVVFGLMNEPHRQTATEWLRGANAAIAAIRSTGARQLVLVPGSYWDSGHTWTTTDNAEVMIGVEDPSNNFVYEVHQYLDSDNSGSHTSVVPGAGSTRLAAFTDWARKHGVRGFLGEFGWADNPEAHREGRDMLCFMTRNSDVWLGWTYWAGGPWWGDYMFSIQPEDGIERPQMKVLSDFIGPRIAPDCP